MERIDTATATEDRLFRDGNPDTGIKATKLNAKWHNNVQEEICNLIEDFGISLSGDDRHQMAKAIRKKLNGPMSVESLAVSGLITANGGAEITGDVKVTGGVSAAGAVNATAGKFNFLAVTGSISLPSGSVTSECLSDSIVKSIDTKHVYATVYNAKSGGRTTVCVPLEKTIGGSFAVRVSGTMAITTSDYLYVRLISDDGTVLQTEQIAGNGNQSYPANCLFEIKSVSSGVADSATAFRFDWTPGNSTAATNDNVTFVVNY